MTHEAIPRQHDATRLGRTLVDDATTRLATSGQTGLDVGRIYLQEDTDERWLLKTTGTNTWRRVLEDSRTFGAAEARPLASAATFADLEVWSWEDEKFPAITGQQQQIDWTIEGYRDTGQLKVFFRHDQQNQLHGDVQMAHHWAGTAASLHLHTIPMANGDGGARWVGAYHFGNLGAELPALASWTSIAVTQAIVAADQYDRKTVSIASCAPPSVPGHSDHISFKLTRDGDAAEDTYTTNKDHGTGAANLCLESYDVHYQRLLTGSFDLTSGRPVVNPARIWFEQVSGGGAVTVEALVRSVGGAEVEFQVWDVAAAAQQGSAVTTSSTSYTRIKFGPFTPADGVRELRIRGRYTGTAEEPVCVAARLLA